MTKEQFDDYLKNDLELEDGEELIGTKHNSDGNSFFAIKKTEEDASTRYNLYGIGKNGEEVWLEETTVNHENQYRWSVELFN